VVDGAALEKRCAKAPWVRIPPSPPATCHSAPVGSRPAGALRLIGERSPRGLGRRTGNAVWGNPSRVRIPPSPPPPRSPCVAGSPRGDGRATGDPGADGADPRYPSRCRARRGTSGALYLQSAPAGLNSHPRSPSSKAALASDVEGRVPRSGDSRTGSGPEGSSPKRCSSGAAVRPGPSRSERWARGRSDRRWVHGALPSRFDTADPRLGVP
jgi:hypothetical protein